MLENGPVGEVSIFIQFCHCSFNPTLLLKNWPLTHIIWTDITFWNKPQLFLVYMYHSLFNPGHFFSSNPCFNHVLWKKRLWLYICANKPTSHSDDKQNIFPKIDILTEANICPNIDILTEFGRVARKCILNPPPIGLSCMHTIWLLTYPPFR